MLTSSNRGLREIEEELRRVSIDKPVLIFLGNPLRGDDKIGLLIGKKFKKTSKYPYVVICSEGLENCASRIKKMGRGKAVIVDAVHANVPGGTIVYVDQTEVARDFLASTHNLPLTLLGEVLGIDFHVLGIQVENTGIDQPLSRSVVKAAKQVLAILQKTFT